MEKKYTFPPADQRAIFCAQMRAKRERQRASMPVGGRTSVILSQLNQFIQNHSLFIVGVSCLLWVVLVLWIIREPLGLPGSKLFTSPFLYVYIFAAIVSAVVFSLITDPLTGFYFSVRHHGLLFLFPAFIPLFSKLLKIDWRDIADIMACTLPGLIAMTRLSCIINGCCYGRCFPGTQTFIPLREIVISVLIAVNLLIIRWYRHGRAKGILLPGFAVFYGFFRLLEIALRFNPDWSNNARDRVFAIIYIALGILLAIVISEFSETQKKSKSKNK